MRHSQHHTTNKVLIAPPGVPHDQCSSLPITAVLYGNVPAVWSFWRPSPSELAALNRGHMVRVSVIGETQPMMAVGVDGTPE